MCIVYPAQYTHVQYMYAIYMYSIAHVLTDIKSILESSDTEEYVLVIHAVGGVSSGEVCPLNEQSHVGIHDYFTVVKKGLESGREEGEREEGEREGRGGEKREREGGKREGGREEGKREETCTCNCNPIVSLFLLLTESFSQTHL